ncbi:MAG: hypothetical protein VXZ18_19415, partial [Pseudomonadota bacterium]|nr:hypothetical protein [Pseudomonadota bacterium]
FLLENIYSNNKDNVYNINTLPINNTEPQQRQQPPMRTQQQQQQQQQQQIRPPMLYNVTAPAGSRPGQVLRVQTSRGLVDVTIPAGI